MDSPKHVIQWRPAQRMLNEIHSCLRDLLSVLWLWGYINSGRRVQGVRARGPPGLGSPFFPSATSLGSGQPPGSALTQTA